MGEEKIILEDSPESAEFKTVTITGWFSSDGFFFGANPEHERMARYHGCTHRKCSCGEIFEKNRWCKPCSEKNSIERYHKKPFKVWDETTPVYSESADEYFYSPEEIDYYLSDHDDVTALELRLIICERIELPTIDEDYFMDAAPEGYEIEDMVSEEFMEALANLNEIAEKEEVNAWLPGEFRTEYLGCDRT